MIYTHNGFWSLFLHWYICTACHNYLLFKTAEKNKKDKKKEIEIAAQSKRNLLDKNKKEAKAKAKKDAKLASKGPALVQVDDGKEKEETDKEIEKLKDIENEEQGVNRSCYTLQNVNFNVKKGQLIAVVGAVGSGKSSLLSGLLGKNMTFYYQNPICFLTLWGWSWFIF